MEPAQIAGFKKENRVAQVPIAPRKRGVAAFMAAALDLEMTRNGFKMG